MQFKKNSLFREDFYDHGHTVEWIFLPAEKSENGKKDWMSQAK